MRFIFTKQISIIGSTMGSHQDFQDVMGLVWAGKLKPVVDRVMPLAEGRAAFAALERGEQFGKVVLVPWQDLHRPNPFPSCNPCLVDW